MAITIMVANQKGGVGKTTTTIELAACFIYRGYTALVIDFDQQTNLTKYITPVVPKYGIYDVLHDEKNIKEVIAKTDEFDIISGSEKLSKADKEFTELPEIVNLRKKLRELDDDYDFILIDTNPGRNVLLNMAYIAADYVIIPAEAEEGSIQGIQAVIKDLNSYKDKDVNMSNAEILGIIITKWERTGMHEYGKELITQIRDAELPDAFIMEVRKSIAATECKSEKWSLQRGKRNTKPAMDYRLIADEIIDRIVEE